MKRILLPKSLKRMDDYSLSGYKPAALVLPDGFEEIHYFYGMHDTLEGIRNIVWPAAFTTVPQYGLDCDTVYFRGSEIQWKLIENIDKVSYRSIIFNYDGDGSELTD